MLRWFFWWGDECWAESLVLALKSSVFKLERHRTAKCFPSEQLLSRETPADTMVYESDFYTSRRPYSRPTVSSYSVTVSLFFNEFSGFVVVVEIDFTDKWYLMSSWLLTTV